MKFALFGFFLLLIFVLGLFIDELALIHLSLLALSPILCLFFFFLFFRGFYFKTSLLKAGAILILAFVFLHLSFLQFGVQLFFNKKVSDFGLKVLSLNVDQFNKNGSKQSLIEFLANSDYDLICLQEFGRRENWQEKEVIVQSFSAAVKMPYYHFASHKDNIFGLAIFSKLPIVQANILTLDLGDMNAVVCYRLMRGTQQISFAHLHLTSYNLSFLKQLPINAWLSFFNKKHQKRNKEIQNLMSFSNDLDFLIGDFNFLPASKQYLLLSKQYDDAALGIVNVPFYTLKPLPLRIDYLWLPNGQTAKRIKVLKENFSDHKALSVKL